MHNRRDFLKISAMAGGALMLPQFAQRARAAFFQTQALQKFVAPLRIFGVDIPVSVPDTTTYPGVDFHQIEMTEFFDKLHPALPDTLLRGYGTQGTTFKHLGGAIVAQKDRPVRVRWTNNLSNVHPLPVDMSLITPYGVGPGIAVNRAAPHLHGGLVPWLSDGGPFHWFSSTLGGAQRVVGPSVLNWLPDPANGGALTDDYWYPNNQSARFLWYHDHAVGITRLNAYAGLATGYILQDAAEGVLMGMLGIPAARQVVMTLQDKIFNVDGSLWYPDIYDIQFFALSPAALPLPVPSAVAEFWGDTMLVNGTAYPFLQVEPRRYRIRILNACNTRVVTLKLVYAAGTTFPANAEPNEKIPGPVLQLIGTEGGFLDGGVVPQGVPFLNTRKAMPLTLAPAERADFIVDFSGVAPGQFLILHNDAPVPFPGGTPLADFYPDNNKLAVPPAPGYSPNTRTLLQFQVVALGTLTGDTNPDAAVDPAWALPPSPAPVPTVNTVRDLALWETVDQYGRLEQNLGTIAAAQFLVDAPTEVVQAGSVETWRIFNLTADTHPIHFHFVNVRVVSRQAFHGRGGGLLPALVSKVLPPEPAEQGWKETVRFNPGECTTLLVDVPPMTGLAPAGVTIPASPRLAAFADPAVAGAEYVWHCHILEHEEHDMMRPLVVQG